MAGSWFRQNEVRGASAVPRPYEIIPITQPEGIVVHERSGIGKRTLFRTNTYRYTLNANANTFVNLGLDPTFTFSVVPIGDVGAFGGSAAVFFPAEKDGLLKIYSYNVDIQAEFAEVPGIYVDVSLVQATLHIRAANVFQSATSFPPQLYSNTLGISSIGFITGFGWDNLPVWRSDDFINVSSNSLNDGGTPTLPNSQISGGIKWCYFNPVLVFKNTNAAARHVKISQNILYDIFDLPRQ